MPRGTTTKFFAANINGPRHAPNAFPLRNSCVQKITDKKLMFFSKKLCSHFKSIIQLVPELLRTHSPLKIRPDFDLKEFENFVSSKKCIFLHFFQNPQISFLIKSIGVDQVLTKIFQIDPKLTFNVFHILNHGRL